MTDSFFPRRIVKAKRRLTATVRPLPMSDETTTDVVRPPDPPRFYAYIDEMEIEKGNDEGQRYDILFFCHSASWFDALEEDLSDMPPINQVARVASMCAVELIATTKLLEDIASKMEKDGEEFDVDLEAVHLSEGWWLEAVFDSDVEKGLPVAVFLPADGSDDPATIGNTDNEFAAALVGLKRIRPPRKLIKLQRLSHGHGL